MEEQHNPWQIKGSTPVYDNPWINVTQYEVINPGGGPGIYGKVHFKNVAVGVLPLDEALNTYLVGQYRFTLNQYSWEMPEGGAPVGEEPLAAAQRELREETGLQATVWKPILQAHLSNSVSDEYGLVFVAQQLTQLNAMPEETEQLQLRKLPFEAVYQMVQRGEITDLLTVAAVLKVKLLLLEGSL